MPDLIWIEEEETRIIHDLQLAEHGGIPGICDLTLLQSALAKPKNLFTNTPQTATLPRLAAAYAFAISRNHRFLDGNKRTSLVVAFTFVELNGIQVVPSQEEAYLTFFASLKERSPKTSSQSGLIAIRRRCRA
jgi:death-on-curing protein